MNICKSIFGPFLFLFALPFSASALDCQIQGTRSDLGAYQGVVQVRAKEQGGFEVVRVVTFEQFRFEGLRVQEVWSGEGEIRNGILQARFVLKRADLFNSVDGKSRRSEEFQQPLEISYSLSLDGKRSVLNFAQIQISEQVLGTSENSEVLWKNERQFLVSKGSSHEWIGRAAFATLFAPLMKKYSEDSFVCAYKNRPEYISGQQYFIFDPTDFEFLKNNPNTLRIANKVIDQISLVESQLRHDAYAPTLQEKQKAFDQDLAKNHLNETGLYSRSVLNAEGQSIGMSSNGDGALWSGMYAGSQAMRWIVTKDPAALENFKKITRGLMLLMDITGDSKEFARTAELMLPGEALSFPWRQGVAPYQNFKYVEGGNNDMIKGLFHAFAWAFEIFPEEDSFLSEVKLHVQRLPDLKIAREYNHPNNWIFTTGLAALATGDQKWRGKYLQYYGLVADAVNELGLTQGFYYGGVADWSGINLMMVSEVTDILIAKNVAKKFGNLSSRKTSIDEKMLRKARQNLMDSWGTFADARRDFLTVAALAFGLGNSLDLSEKTKPQDWTAKELWEKNREMAVWSLREVPLSKTQHRISYDFSLSPDWSLSAWPQLPWKSLGEKPPIAYYYQGAYQYPIFESSAIAEDLFWKGVFDFRASGATLSGNGRIEYLHMYWMARLARLILPGN